MRLIVCSLVSALALVGCSKPSESTPAAPASATAGAAPTKPPAETTTASPPTVKIDEKPAAAAPPAPIEPSAIRAIRCKVANVGTKRRRSLHVDAQGTLYAFDDGPAVHKIPAGSGPCGLGAAVDINGAEYAFAPDGSVEVAKSYEARPDCKSLAFSAFDFDGVVSKEVAFHKKMGELVVENLKATTCESNSFGTPPPSGNPMGVAANDKHVFVMDFHGSGNEGNFVLRYDRTGKFIDKLNVGPDGKAIVRWPDELATCGAGICLLQSGELFVFGADGKLIRKGKVQGDDVKLSGENVFGMVEIPGKGLYLYASAGQSPESDIIRIENFSK
jgi:hypothetical protein